MVTRHSGLPFSKKVFNFFNRPTPGVTENSSKLFDLFLKLEEKQDGLGQNLVVVLANGIYTGRVQEVAQFLQSELNMAIRPEDLLEMSL
jgi:hypothetical protein